MLKSKLEYLVKREFTNDQYKIIEQMYLLSTLNIRDFCKKVQSLVVHMPPVEHNMIPVIIVVIDGIDGNQFRNFMYMVGEDEETGKPICEFCDDEKVACHKIQGIFRDSEIIVKEEVLR